MFQTTNQHSNKSEEKTVDCVLGHSLAPTNPSQSNIQIPSTSQYNILMHFDPSSAQPQLKTPLEQTRRWNRQCLDPHIPQVFIALKDSTTTLHYFFS